MAFRTLQFAAILGLGLAPQVARADEEVIPGHTVNRPVDGAIQGLALVSGLAVKLVPMRDHTKGWDEELMDSDEGVRDNFSRRASHLSDGLFALSIAAPAIYLTGSTIDDADGDRLMLYGQTMAINVGLVSMAKHLVQRPRPYAYSNDPKVKAYAREEGNDAYMSFYSGHAALTFGAAMSGAYLLGASNESRAGRGLAFGLGFGVAAATANLRVRAGKHFYSDVIIGSLVGMAVGYAVPALHADGKPYLPSGEEVAAAGAGILGGLLISQLIPLGKTKSEATGADARFQLGPMPVQNGMGLALAGSM